MLGFSLSEWLLIGIILGMVVAAPRVGKLGSWVAGLFASSPSGDR